MSKKNSDTERKCRVCEKKIMTKIETIARNKWNTTKNRNKVYRTSNEGVLFTLDSNCAWFCNECWELIRK